MIIADKGVAGNSFMDFCIPSTFATENLYYVQQFGTFYCDSLYRVERDYLDSFLLVFMLSGTLNIEREDVYAQAGENQVVLLDCRKAHKYYCNDSCSFLWFHYNGNSSVSYADYIYENGGLVIGDGSDRLRLLRDRFESISFYAQKIPANEHVISSEISAVLAALASHISEQGISQNNHPIRKAIACISDSFTEPLSISELAEMCALSESHFIRVFRKYENMTPHEYILSLRLREAKKMLQTTNESIEYIAEQCGFNSASHFARSFRGKVGISPTEFRIGQKLRGWGTA